MNCSSLLPLPVLLILIYAVPEATDLREAPVTFPDESTTSTGVDAIDPTEKPFSERNDLIAMVK
jgi:hypothetical protein